MDTDQEFNARLVAQLSIEEGVKTKVYLDPKGIPTIGVGRNLRDKGLKPNEIAMLLSDDINDSLVFLSQFLWFKGQNDPRQAALIDMSFMGFNRLLGFVHMIHFLDIGDFQSAHDECVNSQWFTDVGPGRGNRVANMLLTGAWPADIPFNPPSA
jgi:GH24 family phage-related lysozyme (muramidase)